MTLLLIYLLYSCQPIFQSSDVEVDYCRALMRRLELLRLMPSAGSALVQW